VVGAMGVPSSHPNDMFVGRRAPQMSGRAGPRRTEAQMLGIFEGDKMCANRTLLGHHEPQMGGLVCPKQPEAQMLGLADGNWGDKLHKKK
jgi:hypothetical protein